MSAVDDLVHALQAAVSSTRDAHSDATQAATSAAEAVQAAAAFGRENDVAQADAVRADLEQAAATLANTQKELEELLQRATALHGGGT